MIIQNSLACSFVFLLPLLIRKTAYLILGELQCEPQLAITAMISNVCGLYEKKNPVLVAHELKVGTYLGNYSVNSKFLRYLSNFKFNILLRVSFEFVQIGINFGVHRLPGGLKISKNFSYKNLMPRYTYYTECSKMSAPSFSPMTLIRTSGLL